MAVTSQDMATIKVVGKEISFEPMFSVDTIAGQKFYNILDQQVFVLWAGKSSDEIEVSRAISNPIEKGGKVKQEDLNATFQAIIPLALRMVMEGIKTAIIKHANAICNSKEFSSLDMTADVKDLFSDANEELAALVALEVGYAKAIIEPELEWMKAALKSILPQKELDDDAYDSEAKRYLVQALIAHCHLYIGEHMQTMLLSKLDPTDDIEGQYSAAIVTHLLNRPLSTALINSCSKEEWQNEPASPEILASPALNEARKSVTQASYKSLIQEIQQIVSPPFLRKREQALSAVLQMYGRFQAVRSNDQSPYLVLNEIKEMIQTLNKSDKELTARQYYSIFNEIVNKLREQNQCSKCNEMLEKIVSNPAYKAGLVAEANIQSASLLAEENGVQRRYNQNN